MIRNRLIRAISGVVAAACYLFLPVAVGYADATRPQSAFIAALADNPNPHSGTGEIFRWLTEVDVRFYGSCGVDGLPNDANFNVLDNFLREITQIGAELSFTLRTSDCASDLEPADPDSFGIAVIVGGGMRRVLRILDSGMFGDGSEIIVATIENDAGSTGCFSSTGKRDGTGRILAAIVYIDPSVMEAHSARCIKTAFLSALGFSGAQMAPYPESLLAFTDPSARFSDLDRCLIATLYARQLRSRYPTISDFNRELPDLMRSAKYCEEK